MASRFAHRESRSVISQDWGLDSSEKLCDPACSCCSISTLPKMVVDYDYDYQVALTSR